MSGWTVITVRGKESKNYEYSRFDDTDPYHATSDITATMEEDGRVRQWTTWAGHVYAYLSCGRYDWEFAEDLLEDYSEMVRDAVVLGANDTTDTGCARYYHRPDLRKYKHQYEETQGDDGCQVGEIALSVMNAHHGIVSRDPFHNQCDGWGSDERYLDEGQSRLE